MKRFLTVIFGLICLVTTTFGASQQLINSAANAIDNQLSVDCSAVGLKENPIINDDQFVKRAYLSIIGRIPTYAEYEQFTKINNPAKRAELILFLVNTDGYTSNMYNMWSEQLRTRDKLNNINLLNGSLYIDWIKTAIKNNISYTNFVKQLLLSDGDYFSNPAVGYYERDLGMPLDNVVFTMKSFIGTDITCAQCHDSAFEEWTQKQFYQMAAAFSQIEISGRKNPAAAETIKKIKQEIEATPPKDDKEKQAQRQLLNQVNQFVSATLANVSINSKKQLKYPFDYKYKDANPNDIVEPKVLTGSTEIYNTEDTRTEAVAWLTSPQHPTFTKNIVNRYWKHVFGKAIVSNVNNIHGNDKNTESLMLLLENIFQKLNYNSKDFIQVLGTTKLFQRESYRGNNSESDKYVFIGPVLNRLSAEQMWDSILSIALERPEYFSPTYPDIYKNIMKIEDYSILTLADIKSKTALLNEANAKKYYSAVKFKGFNLVRASEINDLGQNNTLLATLGRGSRELIGTSSREGSVTQVISLVNGPLVDIATMKESHLKTLLVNKSPSDKVEIIFKSILSRKPTLMEKSIFVKASDDDLIWALINTNEFKFQF